MRGNCSDNRGHLTAPPADLGGAPRNDSDRIRILELHCNPSPSRNRRLRAGQAAITAPVSHQKRSQRDATNTIERAKSSGKSTPAILVPPLITVWLEVRVLPGPPTTSIGCDEPGTSNGTPWPRSP